jgi:cytosine/uracil/thiamine/allantoin permease
MGVIVGASLIISMIAVVAGWMGSHDYLGFTVMSRAYVPIFGGLFKVLTKLQIMGHARWILACAESYCHSMHLVRCPE